jgi:hypothetical protein
MTELGQIRPIADECVNSKVAPLADPLFGTFETLDSTRPSHF